MTHQLPPHDQLPPEMLVMAPTFTADGSDQVQQSGSPSAVEQQLLGSQPSTPAASIGRKRKKASGSVEGVQSPTEPRRLRRSHEACARCRNKKIKCDSKHPRCTACATANVECQQEDRAKQSYTPRGYTDLLEQQLGQFEQLLKRMTGCDISRNHVGDVLAQQQMPGPIFHVIPGHPPPIMGTPLPGPPPGPDSSGRGMQAFPGQAPPPNFAFFPPGLPFQPGVMAPMMPPNTAMFPPGTPFAGQPQVGVYGFSHHDEPDLKGADPKKNNMSSASALVNTFSVALESLQTPPADTEDLAVGSGGLASGRDRNMSETFAPKDQNKWKTLTMRRTSIAYIINVSEDEVQPAESPIAIYLPENRAFVGRIVQVYFKQLNPHRPVFARHVFEQKLAALYENRNGHSHDPGFICSLYLVLALGTMCEINNAVGKTPEGFKSSESSIARAIDAMPKDWPTYTDFFERALTIKPDLKVTLSSLQALILLHWYLYTERQGRSLWRLVGSLVRLSVEMGLHHDPLSQEVESRDSNNVLVRRKLFTPEESQERLRLWSIVLLHDRGTSVLLGRPLAMHPLDSNSPAPVDQKLPSEPALSEHFRLSHPIINVQAEIVTSLYRPHVLDGKELLAHTKRILESLTYTRRNLFGEKYKYYFEGTRDWPEDKRVALVEAIGLNEGLNLLKTGITRLLIMRALFRPENGVSQQIRDHALHDAVITAHNIIVIHNQLIRFPDAAFFVSPIPLHICAFYILYGKVYNCPALNDDVQRADVWMALHMLPQFRWRWDRKDWNGGHPYLYELACHVFNIDKKTIGPLNSPAVLFEETIWANINWDASSVTVMHPSLPDSLKAEVTPSPSVRPEYGLYPFHNEELLAIQSRTGIHPSSSQAQEWMPHGGMAGYRQSSTSFMQEERDGATLTPGAPSWMSQHSELPLGIGSKLNAA